MALGMDMDDFFHWLAAFRPDEIVGLPGQCFHSPLARFLSDQAGCAVGVDGERYGSALADPCCWRLLPRWAMLFTVLSEKLFGSSLTAYEAVGLLVEVETQLAPVLVVETGRGVCSPEKVAV
jgi:hypothetical protein